MTSHYFDVTTMCGQAWVKVSTYTTQLEVYNKHCMLFTAPGDDGGPWRVLDAFPLDTFVATEVTLDPHLLVLHVGLPLDLVSQFTPPASVADGLAGDLIGPLETGDTGVLVGRVAAISDYLAYVSCEADPVSGRPEGLGIVVDVGRAVFTLQGLDDEQTHAWATQIKYHIASGFTRPLHAADTAGLAASAGLVPATAVVCTSAGGASFAENMSLFRKAFASARLVHAPLLRAGIVLPGEPCFLGSDVARWIAATFATATVDQIAVIGQSMILEGVIEPVADSGSRTFKAAFVVYRLTTAAPPASEAAAGEKPVFKFGGGAAGSEKGGAFKFSFGKPAAAAGEGEAQEDKPKFKFGGGSSSFKFGGFSPAGAADAAAEGEQDEAKTNPKAKAKVTLEEVEVKTHEEDEDIALELRARLYRMDDEAEEWKERGTGTVKLLKHKETGKVRILMRRDKTLKICANHFITADMKLVSNPSSDKVWMWKTLADRSDSKEGIIDDATEESLLIRFGSVENAQKFKAAFEAAANGEDPAAAAAAVAGAASTTTTTTEAAAAAPAAEAPAAE
ncbi:ran-specific GTPase-activating protein [Thecamonas trahens ATCC 50062]|uniref:Ran-specific GTPase-activating protein n=1 Tax=Thecamonas trahens ATCC 50062 TaxID=461836 RepID=A0A0L0DGP4_THETB|nr:ran-specific GTPase-activating protein [Thecamonas trahens ATCC 50062]KNC51291.1 ran-specific GTPase-activating protein [Thecamonas trahens ATCC 50062]|eukprot:XP_013756215.1 ran-specific GTPase-activating protein [Thecamonas trahens ATCC 50062]